VFNISIWGDWCFVWGANPPGIYLTLLGQRVCCRFQPPEAGKVPGSGFHFPEFTLYAGPALKSWFCDFLNSCMHQIKIPKIWREALIQTRKLSQPQAPEGISKLLWPERVAVPKPEKSLGDSKSYRPTSLLCVLFKILERLIYARVETIIDPLLPQEQAGFRHGRST